MKFLDWGVRFLLIFQGFKGSQGEKILADFEVFLGIFEKTKEKKDRIGAQKRLQKVGKTRKIAEETLETEIHPVQNSSLEMRQAPSEHTTRVEMFAYTIYLEGLAYPEYAMQILWDPQIW